MNADKTRYNCEYGGGFCATNTCKADEELVFALGGGITPGLHSGLFHQLNPEFVTNLDGSGFDHQARCGSSGVSVASTNFSDSNSSGGNSHSFQCCGEYPHRFSYNSNRYQCCADGNIASNGSCWRTDRGSEKVSIVWLWLLIQYQWYFLFVSFSDLFTHFYIHVLK